MKSHNKLIKKASATPQRKRLARLSLLYDKSNVSWTNFWKDDDPVDPRFEDINEFIKLPEYKSEFSLFLDKWNVQAHAEGMKCDNRLLDGMVERCKHGCNKEENV